MRKGKLHWASVMVLVLSLLSIQQMNSSCDSGSPEGGEEHGSQDQLQDDTMNPNRDCVLIERGL